MEVLITAAVVGVLLLVLIVGLVTSRRGAPPPVDAETEQALRERQTEPGPPPETTDAGAVAAPPRPVEPPGEDVTAPAEPVSAETSATEAPPEPEVEPEAAAVEPEAPPLTARQRFRRRLGRARAGLGGSVAGAFRRGVNEEAWEELEEALIGADVGVETSLELVAGLRDRARAEGVRTGEQALALLKEVLRLELSMSDRTLHLRPDGTSVWLVTGVNGTGKTTSIGKIAARMVRADHRVVLAAADTFRAAAIEQLELWGQRAGTRVVKHTSGADPAAVAFDGYQAAAADRADVLVIDTAGRLQNKSALMAELSKVKRVVEREAGPCDEVLLVLDATTGQNGLAQAKAFMDAVDVTGVVLTKLDGTAKGGIVIAIQRQLGLPVKLVGLGEDVEDLAEFDPDAFVEALFTVSDQDVEADADGDDSART